MAQRRDPITGEMVEYVPRERVVKAPPNPGMGLPAEVIPLKQGDLSEKLADIRQEWIDIGPSGRSGAKGSKLMSKYRRMSLEYWHLTGKHPPLIHADM